MNRELVLLYWHMGWDISARMREHGWGAQVVDRLTTDLRRRLPTMQGFSPRNLRYMRSFAETTLRAALASGLSERDAVRQVSTQHHLSRRGVYAEMLALKSIP